MNIAIAADVYAPRYIKLNARDNVAIIVNDFGLPAGAKFACGLELRNFVPQGHKVALADIALDAPIVRYGEVIGYALQPILAGEWVEEARIRMPEAPDLDRLDIATAVPAPQPALTGYTFEGFRNADGSVGVKNILAISTSVQCVAGTLEFALKRIKAELLPRYPNVDDVVAVTHAYGCGVAINAPDAMIPIRTLQNIAKNPNFGGEVMVVGLGCEKLAPERLIPEGSPAHLTRLQDEGNQSFGDMVETIFKMADTRLKVLNERKRETCPASDLTVGLQCGGSDAFSGVTANPALGFASDLLVRAGATVRTRLYDIPRVVEVGRVIEKRVGAPEAVTCYVDHTPPPPPKETVAAVAHRERGAGRPTKRDRRRMEAFERASLGHTVEHDVED